MEEFEGFSDVESVVFQALHNVRQQHPTQEHHRTDVVTFGEVAQVLRNLRDVLKRSSSLEASAFLRSVCHKQI